MYCQIIPFFKQQSKNSYKKNSLLLSILNYLMNFSIFFFYHNFEFYKFVENLFLVINKIYPHFFNVIMNKKKEIFGT